MPQWPKGVSGNPRGRPRKGSSLAEALEHYGQERDPETGERRYDLLAQKLWAMALGGHIEAIRYVYDRALGKPPVAVELRAETPPLMFVLQPPGQRASPDMAGGKPAKVPLLQAGQSQERDAE